MKTHKTRETGHGDLKHRGAPWDAPLQLRLPAPAGPEAPRHFPGAPPRCRGRLALGSQRGQGPRTSGRPGPGFTCRAAGPPSQAPSTGQLPPPHPGGPGGAWPYTEPAPTAPSEPHGAGKQRQREAREGHRPVPSSPHLLCTGEPQGAFSLSVKRRSSQWPQQTSACRTTGHRLGMCPQSDAQALGMEAWSRQGPSGQWQSHGAPTSLSVGKCWLRADLSL